MDFLRNHQVWIARAEIADPFVLLKKGTRGKTKLSLTVLIELSMYKVQGNHEKDWERMIRTILAWAAGLAATVILGILVIFLSLFHSSGNLSHLVARLWGKVPVWTTGTKVTVQGMENIDPLKSYILVSNHQSFFDIFSLLGYLPIQFRWIAKEELFRIPVLGWAMSRAGYIPIERDSPKKAYRSMLQAAEKIRQGTSVLIFPEGTRSPDGNLQPFKKGVFLIALKSQAPILPVTIRGTRSIMRKNDWRTYPGNVQIIISSPIDTAGFSTAREAELSEQVRNTLLHNLTA
jgi:1-acyl-sn-glycerol-3-phosphate acyltransferase